MNQFETELKIIAEDMAKLYEHTDKIIKKDGKTLVDVKFNVTEEQVDFELIKRVIELLEKYKKDCTQEELTNLVNTVKRDAARKINNYRQEKEIKDFEGNDIEL